MVHYSINRNSGAEGDQLPCTFCKNNVWKRKVKKCEEKEDKKSECEEKDKNEC